MGFFARLALAAVLIFMSVSNGFAAVQDDEKFDPTRTDHKAHMAVSGAMTLAFSSWFSAKNVALPVGKAALLTMALGVGKELADQQANQGDITANAVGSFSGAVLAVGFGF